jgi:radical SAM superfamily enzyme YgiQ (UPF0313 family)
MKVLFVIYDNDAHVSEFPLGVAYLASALRDAGHEVVIYSQDVFHYQEEHLTKYLDSHSVDMVAMGMVAGYFQYKKLLLISSAVNKSVNRKNFVYVLGGHMFSPEPEYFLRKSGADYVVIGEGERTIVELCAVLGKVGMEYLPQVNGLAYLKDNKLVKTNPRELIQNLDLISFPSWFLFDMNHYCLSPFPNMKYTDRTFPVLASRGCIFTCNFCYRMVPGIRFRSPQNIVEEIRLLKERYHITYIAFYDELLMGSVQRTKDICNAIIDSNLDIRWCCDGRLNFATTEVLKLMKKAGCVFINYGIESLDEKVLKNMNKKLTIKQINQGVNNTIMEKISPGLNLIWGNIGDSESSLRKSVDFILSHTDYSQMRTIRPVTPYPGSELYYDAIKEGKLKDIKDFYENKHKNSDLLSVNFTNLTDEQFYTYLFSANKTLIKDYLDHQFQGYIDVMRKIYNDRDASFRGFRHT